MSRHTFLLGIGGQGGNGAPGPAGPAGDPGPAGPQGPMGYNASFSQRFAIPSDTWVIVHNLGAYPAIVTLDDSGEEIYGDVTFPDLNTTIVSFWLPFAGEARLLA